MMALLETTNGYNFVVDEDLFEKLSQHAWYATGRDYTYAQTCIDGVKTYMHRLLAECADHEVVDHIDGNPYNNQLSNLRVVTTRQNRVNSISRVGTSSYKGVSWYERQQKWVMKYYEDGRQVHGGYFDDEREAARQYNQHMLRIHGEYAKLNVLSEEEKDCG